MGLWLVRSENRELICTAVTQPRNTWRLNRSILLLGRLMWFCILWRTHRQATDKGHGHRVDFNSSLGGWKSDTPAISDTCWPGGVMTTDKKVWVCQRSFAVCVCVCGGGFMTLCRISVFRSTRPTDRASEQGLWLPRRRTWSHSSLYRLSFISQLLLTGQGVRVSSSWAILCHNREPGSSILPAEVAVNIFSPSVHQL